MTVPTSPLLDARDGRRLADLARARGRRLPWRISTATADHLVAQRAVDHVRTVLEQHAGPMLVGQVHIVAAGPANAARRLEQLRRGVDDGTIVGYPTETFEKVAASLAADHRRWFIYAAARVLNGQCAHSVAYS